VALFCRSVQALGGAALGDVVADQRLRAPKRGTPSFLVAPAQPVAGIIVEEQGHLEQRVRPADALFDEVDVDESFAHEVILRLVSDTMPEKNRDLGMLTV
jgi:hypothetical protein